MSQVDPQAESKKDPADALAHLASGGEVVVPAEASDPGDPTEALGKLEAGQDLDQAQPPPATGDPVQSASGGAAAPVAAGSPAAPPARPPVDRAKLQQVHAQAAAHMYKKTMIPLLLVVGGLLVMVGILSACMVLGGRWRHAQRALTLVTVISFPLAGVLFFGAWWFRRDVRAGK